MSMLLKFFALIKEVFSSVDYTNKINFKRWTVFYYSDSEFYIWLTATLLMYDLNINYALCRTNGLPTNQLLAILA